MITVSMPRMSFERDTARIIQIFATEVMSALGHPKAKITVNVRKTTLDAGILGVAKDGKVVTLRETYEGNFEFLSTLAHELIHCGQHMDGRMAVWRKETPPTTPYMERPWEREAFATEGRVALSAIRAILLADPTLRTGHGCYCGRFGDVLRAEAVRSGLRRYGQSVMAGA